MVEQPQVVTTGRAVLLSHPPGEQALTVPAVCAMPVVCAERQGWRRLERQSPRAVPVVSPVLTTIVHAPLDVRPHDAPVLGEQTCCTDRQEARLLTQSTPPSCVVAAQ
jgi:hypothetical protein